MNFIVILKSQTFHKPDDNSNQNCGAFRSRSIGGDYEKREKCKE